ncbi:fumarylacetoacetate hydrolase family protein [Aliikangiella coralliicola]|uniref:Fumarylacetoacetate hydrolase family protein n=2 Tax=Aliikangiella coralliicola TaxID=2592383 RepID=A0A545U981_9GAMM|nr:fumarylacetoacetate hydrolase family protein [Aliikangiella coralliicola]
MISKNAFSDTIKKYIRYKHSDTISYGILEGDTIYQLKGNVFNSPHRTGKKVLVKQVEVLPPTDPKKVIAVGYNYKSHIDDLPMPKEPVLFTKLPTSLIGHGGHIQYFADARNLHFEGEMVLVIGKTATKVSVDEAPDYIFAVTPGNDVSERNWQDNDVQWFRGKASDTFGPVGPVMVSGVNYDNLQLRTRVNGKTKQSQRTKDMIFSSAEIVSYISQYVTLEPGDLVFTGTPGKTGAIQPGDVVEVDLEKVGLLRNTVSQKEN